MSSRLRVGHRPDGSKPQIDRRLVACLVGFATLGFAVRSVFAIAWPTVHRPDETFQNLEPAYRLLTGWGFVSWEWRDGIRSWLFPDILYAVLRAADVLHLPLLPTVATLLSALATTGVIVAVLVGWRRYRLPGAVICGALAALWPDLVYFGPKPLLEVQAATLMFAAAGLASLDRSPARPRLIAIGLLLGLAFDFRFQLAPALAVVAIGTARRNLRGGWLPLLAAAAVPVLMLGLLDWVTWGSPFQSIWKNIAINFFDNRAEIYGVEPFYWYAADLIGRYGTVSILLALCFGLGVRAAPLLAATAVAVVAFHSLIAHKEISFIYAALPCGLVVAGLGAARLWARLVRDSAATPRALFAAAFACAAVAALAGHAARPFLEPSAQPELRDLWSILRARSDLCGLALYGDTRFPWFGTPGYVGLQRPIPIVALLSPADLDQAGPSFNYIVVDTSSVSELPGGEHVACDGRFCLLRRTNACQSVTGFDINTVIHRVGQ